MLGGVASGIARYFGLDPTIVRLVWILLTFFNPVGIVIYLIAWIIIPPAPDGGATATFAQGERLREQVIESAKEIEARFRGQSRGYRGDGADDRRRVLGWILVGIGVLLLLRNMLSWLQIGRLWPVLLIVAGAVLIVQGMRK